MGQPSGPLRHQNQPPVGDALFIMDNGPVPLANIHRKFRCFLARTTATVSSETGATKTGDPGRNGGLNDPLDGVCDKNFGSVEWGAANIKPRGVMIEELLTDDNHLPNDWKVHVFNGKAGFIQYDIGRMSSHSQSIYTLEGQRIHQTNTGGAKRTPPMKSSRCSVRTFSTNSSASPSGWLRISITPGICFLPTASGILVNLRTTIIPVSQSIEWEKLAVACG